MYFYMAVGDAWLVLRPAECWRRVGQCFFSGTIGHWSACQGTSSALVQSAAAKATTTAAAAVPCLSLKRQLYMQNWVHYALCKTRLLFMSFRLIMSVVQLLLMHDLLCFLHSGMLSLLLLLHSRFCAVTPKMKHSAAYVTKPHMKNCLQIQPCCLCLQLTQKAINNA